jgi:hypothetical protein
MRMSPTSRMSFPGSAKTHAARDPLVYYRSRRKAEGGRQLQVYLGTGVVGDIRPRSASGRLVCDFLDSSPFPSPVPFKDGRGSYLERGDRVEAISSRVCGLSRRRRSMQSSAGQLLPKGSSGGERPSPRTPGGLYAAPEVARAVEEYSRHIAAAHLRATHPGAAITGMPTNNPGFDLETDSPGARL